MAAGVSGALAAPDACKESVATRELLLLVARCGEVATGMRDLTLVEPFLATNDQHVRASLGGSLFYSSAWKQACKCQLFPCSWQHVCVGPSSSVWSQVWETGPGGGIS